MKTNTFNNIATRFATIVAAIVLGLNFTSCSSTDAEPANPASAADQVSSAHVTFTYTVPEELLQYVEITVCRNNNEGTDAQWYPMLDPQHTVTYDLAKVPVMAPVIFILDPNNRLTANSKSVEWDLKMDVEVTMNIGGRHVVKTNSETFHISGDLRKAIYDLQKNVLDRTYAVKINKIGAVEFVH